MEQDLRRLLDQLSAAIERTKEGHEDRAELTRLLEAVERRLRSDDPAVDPADTTSERPGHLTDALRQAELRFEAEHPLLGEALRDAIHALSSAGI